MFTKNLAASAVVASVFSFFSMSLTVFGSGWNYANDPNRIAEETGKPFQYNFKKLPVEGALTQKPWTDDYWPTYKRGLASRWQGDLVPVRHKNESAYDFEIRSKKERFFTEQEIIFMSEAERNKLSPAEKMDIINGDYDYTLTKSELDRTDPNAPTWEGICHGWASAAIHFKEPAPCKADFGGGFFTSPKGKIPFATSDTKALLSLMQGNYNRGAKSYFAGTRCNDKKEDIDFENSEHQNDINAGAFHIILANRIALQNKGFVYDRTVDSEVWNQPVEGYKTRVIEEKAPDMTKADPRTKKEVRVETLVKYTAEVEPHAEPLNGGDRMQFTVDQAYEYILELDERGNIVGGRFMDSEHPDFVWSESKAGFSGKFKALKSVYKDATGDDSDAGSWFFGF